MAEESDVEKTEPASPQRLQKARDEGQVARSRELNTCMILLTGAAILWVASAGLFDRLIRVMRQSMTVAWDPKSDIGDTREMTAALGHGMIDAIIGLLPLFAGLIVIAILSSTMLGGLVFSAKALEPKFSRMNLFKGLGRMVSANTWIELLKTLCKAGLIGTIATMGIMHFVPKMLSLSYLSLSRALAEGIDIVALTCVLVISSLVLITLIDVPWQMYSHFKKLRMSKEEVKREHKESEGDPHVKGRIRQQQREVARRRMMSEVPNADVIVTNPTHYAVALAYDQNGQGAPKVLAKGTGHIAHKIKEIGQTHRVAQLEAPALARALYAHTEIGQEVPEKLYTAVAQVLAWVFQLRAASMGQGPVPAAPQSLPVPVDMDPHHRGDASDASAAESTA